MKRFAVLLLIITAHMFTSCQGQGKSATATHVFADTVSTISNSILYVFQDRDDNYWFGSDGEGMYRYDGKTIVRFDSVQGLCNSRVRGFQQDKQGNILINTLNGISKFDGHTFQTMKAVGNGTYEGHWRLQPDDLWFTGAQDSGVVYRYDGKVLHRLRFPRTKAGEDFIATYPRAAYPQMTFSPYDVYSIYADKKGHLWLGTNIGVCRYDGKTFEWIAEDELGIDAIAIHVRSTVEDKDGAYWFTNTMHRFYIGSSTGKKPGFVDYKKEKGIAAVAGQNAADFAYFMSGTVDSSGDIWMATYSNGVWRYDGKRMYHYPIADKGVTLFTIYKDKQNSLWLGTHQSGAYRFNGTSFERFRPGLK